MAEIIEFPSKSHAKLSWRFASRRTRIMQALKFLFKNFSTLQPKRMIVIYELEDAGNIYYLNLGYRCDELADAVGEVMISAKDHPDAWE